MNAPRLVDHRGAPLEHSRRRVNGVDLHVAVGGWGPPLYLVHGCPKTMTSWRRLLPHLTDRHTVVLLDCRGFGDSERPLSGYDTDTMASDVVGVADHLGHQRFSVMGEDWGAAIAYAVSAGHRDRVEHLVYQEMRLPGLPPDPDAADLSPDDTRTAWHFSFFKVPGYPELLMQGREQPFWTQFIRRQAHDVDALREEDLGEIVAAISRPGGLHAVLALYRAFDIDVAQIGRQRADPLEMPVLAVGGASYLGDEVRRHMALVAKNVTGHIVERAGHHPALEQPEALAGRVRTFLAGD